jgi:EmrB/QacA subfamily drug resistance transporter
MPTRPNAIMSVLCAAVFMLLLDATIVNVAQARIRESLDAGLTEMQWIIDAYLLTFAILLLASGRLGDIFGRRRLFLIGIAIFSTASALCAAASLLGELTGVSGAAILIGARALQGVGTAAIMPQTMALISVAFPPNRRGAAYGTISAVSAIAAAAGPLSGGLILSWLSWEWIFLINILPGIAVFLAARRILPEATDPLASRRVDLPGMLLSGTGLLAIVVAMIEGAHYGWLHPAILGLAAGGLTLLTAFVLWQRHAPDPMMKLELFRIRNFWAGNVAMALINIAVHGFALPLAIFLQGPAGYSPLKAGIVIAPSALCMAVISPLAGRLSDRIGARRLLGGGFILIAAGLLLLAGEAEHDVSFPTALVAMAIVGVGCGLGFSQANAVPMRDAPVRIAGSAAGILNTTRATAQVLGVTFLSSLLGWLAATNARETLATAPLTNPTRDQAIDAVGEGRFDHLSTIGTRVDQLQLAALTPDLQAAFGDAMRLTLFAAALVALAGAATALLVHDHVTEQVSSPELVEVAGD